MKTIKKKYKMIIRQIITYMALFILLVGILDTMLYISLVTDTQKQVQKNHIGRIRQVGVKIDNYLEQVNNIPYTISSSYYKDLFLDGISRDKVDARAVASRFREYRANDLFIEDIFLYIRGNNKIYSSSGMNSLGTFAQNVYNYEQWSFEDFTGDLDSLDRFALRASENVRVNDEVSYTKIITIMYPIPINQKIYSGTLMLLIREYSFASIMENVLDKSDGAIALVDRDNRIVFSNIHGIDMDMEAIKPYIKDSDGSIEYVKINGERYAVSFCSSEAFQLKYVYIIPEQRFLSEVTEKKKIFSYVSIFLTALFFIIATVVTLKNYKSVKRVLEYLKKSKTEGEQDDSENEMEYIYSSVTDLVNEKQQLRQQLELKDEFYSNQVILNLLNGKVADLHQGIDPVASLGLKNGYKYFVILVSLPGEYPEYFEKMNSVAEAIKNISPKDGMTLPGKLEAEGIIIVITGLDPSLEELGERSRLCTRMVEILENQLISGYKICVGNLYEGVNNIKNSYIDARTAMEYKAEEGNSGIIIFDEIKFTREHEVWLSDKDIIRLKLCIKQGNNAVAQEILEDIMEDIRSQFNSAMILRLVSADLLNSIIRAANEIEFTITMHDLETILSGYDSLEGIRPSISALIGHICEYVTKKNENKDVLLKEKIIAFINQRYMKIDFSMNDVADHVGMSVSIFSRVFKEQFGENFLNYITTLRLNQVKKLLKTTNMSVKEIITSVGYIDLANYGRKFKKMEGVTLGEYRQLHSKSKDSPSKGAN